MGSDDAQSRMSVARAALARGDFVSVATRDDLLGDADAGIGIWDVVAHAFSELVDASVAIANGVAGVDRVVREDREFVAVYGEDVDVAELEHTMRTWWQTMLERAAAGEIGR